MSLCNRHARHWIKAGRPEIDGWLDALPADPATAGQGRECAVPGCPVWAEPEGTLCRVHQRQWVRHGRPRMDEWLARTAGFGPALPSRSTARAAAGLKLDLQYELQRRSDDQTVRVRPREVRGTVAFLRKARAGSVLDEGLGGAAVLAAHRGLLLTLPGSARPSRGCRLGRRVSPRTWQLRRLRSRSCATIRFADISQLWLKDLAKRWARDDCRPGCPATSTGRLPDAHPTDGLPPLRATPTGSARQGAQKATADLH